MDPATTHSRVVGWSCDEAATSVYVDSLEGSFDFLARKHCLDSGNRPFQGIQSRKGKAYGTGGMMYWLAKIEGRCSTDSSPCHSLVKTFRWLRSMGLNVAIAR